jgi:acetyl-CoA C-acetyltransferase
MPEAVIVATARTPIGRAFKGSLIDVRPDDLGALVLTALLAQVPGLDHREIDDVICGAASEFGEQGYNLGRVVGQLAGLPVSVPGTTVNRFCSSSLQAIRMAYHAIVAGEGDTFVAMGVESTTRTAGNGFATAHHNCRFSDPDRADYINDMYIAMGITAENVADLYSISRERMDVFAELSHTRAVAAQDDGFFGDEITPITRPDGGVVTADDGPRRNTSLETLAGLPAVFCEGGRVTAGNSCPLNDGAAAVLVMSETRARQLGLQPMARILGSSVSALEPELMGLGPITAIRKMLPRIRLSVSDFDVIEINEAFAAQVLAVVDELSIDVERLNPHGGAIALGHPFGSTGARMTTTLLHELSTMDKTLGLATMCVGGGQGMAMAFERLT